MEEFEHKGKWWLPEYPDQKVAGTIKFNSLDGSKLDLVDNSLEKPLAQLKGRDYPYFPAMNPHPEEIDVICGQLSDNQFVTLYKCYDAGFSTTFFVRVVFLGYLFTSKSEIVLDEIDITYPNLEDWTIGEGFYFKDHEDIQQEEIAHDIRYKFSKELTANTEHFSISVHDVVNTSYKSNEISLKRQSWFTIKAKSKHFDEYFSNACRVLENFLSLEMANSVRPSKIIGKTQQHKFVLPGGQEILHDIFIYYRTGKSHVESSEFNHFGILFYLNHIRDNFDKYVGNWFNKAGRLKPVCDLYFGTLSSSSIYTEHAFLNFIHALEVYHRRMYGGYYLAPKDFEPIRDALFQAIPSNLENSHRESLKGRIKYGYEFSLRKRLNLILKEILKPYVRVVRKLVIDIDPFVSKVVDTRNYLTHYSEELEHQSITYAPDLHDTTQKLGHILEMCFLVELEMPEKDIESILTKNQRFGFFEW